MEIVTEYDNVHNFHLNLNKHDLVLWLKLKNLRSGSAARLAGWEQISTSEEEEETKDTKQTNGNHDDIKQKQSVSIINAVKSNVNTTSTTTSSIALHKCKSICTGKVNNSSEIVIKSLINQNDLLRQENVNTVKFVNKSELHKKKSNVKKTPTTTIHSQHVKFSCPRIKHFTSSIKSSSSISPSTLTLKSLGAKTKSSFSSLTKLSESIPLKRIFDSQSSSTVKSSPNIFNTVSSNVNCNATSIKNNTDHIVSGNTLIYEVKQSTSSVDYSNHILRVPVLGSRQSGKTTLVKQFINCIDPGNPLPTYKHPDYYDPMISFNDRIYHVRLIDCPPIDKKFPTNSIDEWENYRGWGLRNASAFILIFDVNSESSFQYIRQLRDQIVSEFNDIPLILVANKIDLLQQITTNGLNSNNIIPSFYSTSSSSSSALTTSIPGQLQMIQLNNSTYRFNIRRDINMIIKKQWKRTVLVECSAKYNWHVMNVFKELMRILENREQAHKPTAARAVQNALRNNQCSMM
ncbi:Ras-like protein family member 10B [Schistosoma japonicum]|uniref:Ras-like protein family member 10B n=1 Tax=Schistosoma japonicum TaxID=6182 RepID=A0A4Z2DAC7_SCHJA|nr:Ras-like protein family member 10B [Schistosoma japonicum]